MQKLSRSKSMNFRVSDEEFNMIKRRQTQTGIKNTRAYLLKQAIDGRVIQIELDSVKKCTQLLSNLSNNINQIARRANASGDVYVTDIQAIQATQNEIWAAHKEVLHKINKLLESVK